MSIVRVNYTISSETKEKTEHLRKEYGSNISELVDILLKFDIDSIRKVFEMYSMINKNIISEYNYIQTPDCYFVFGESAKDLVRKIPTKKMDRDKINLLSLYAAELADSTDIEEYKRMLQNQQMISNVASATWSKYTQLEKKVEQLEKKVEQLEKRLENK